MHFLSPKNSQGGQSRTGKQRKYGENNVQRTRGNNHFLNCTEKAGDEEEVGRLDRKELCYNGGQSN